jgi:hypothetical protein
MPVKLPIVERQSTAARVDIPKGRSLLSRRTPRGNYTRTTPSMARSLYLTVSFSSWYVVIYKNMEGEYTRRPLHVCLKIYRNSIIHYPGYIIFSILRNNQSKVEKSACERNLLCLSRFIGTRHVNSVGLRQRRHQTVRAEIHGARRCVELSMAIWGRQLDDVGRCQFIKSGI